MSSMNSLRQNSENAPPTIRFAVQKDFPQWLNLWEGYNKFYGRSGPTDLSAEVTKTTWARFFEPDEPMHALVANRNGVLLGLAHYIFHRSTTLILPTCYMQDIFVSEPARKQGIARSLINAVYEQAKIAGSPRVYWQTHESNLTAIKLYDKIAERSGFIVYRKDV